MSDEQPQDYQFVPAVVHSTPGVAEDGELSKEATAAIRNNYLELLQLPMHSPVAQASTEVKALFAEASLMAAVDDAQLTCSYPICGHLSATAEKKLHICRRRAGLNTDHEGIARCFIHDPKGAFVEPASPYARQLQHVSSMHELFEDMESSKSQFKSLNQELTMARTVLAAQLKQLSSSGRRTTRNQDVMTNVMHCLEIIRKLAESAAKIQTAGSQQLTLDGVSAFLWVVQQVIEQEVSDPHVRLRVLDRLSTEAKFTIG